MTDLETELTDEFPEITMTDPETDQLKQDLLQHERNKQVGEAEIVGVQYADDESEAVLTLELLHGGAVEETMAARLSDIGLLFEYTGAHPPELDNLLAERLPVDWDGRTATWQLDTDAIHETVQDDTANTTSTNSTKNYGKSLENWEFEMSVSHTPAAALLTWFTADIMIGLLHGQFAGRAVFWLCVTLLVFGWYWYAALARLWRGEYTWVKPDAEGEAGRQE